MADRLDLDTLEAICNELDIAESWFDRSNRTGTLHIGGGVNGRFIGRIDNMDIAEGEKLLKVLTSLPRLIEMAYAKQASDDNRDWE